MNKERVKLYYAAEIEKLDNVVRLIVDRKTKVNTLEIAGLGVYLHNFYNGIENVLKRVLEYKKIKIKNTQFWHKQLLLSAFKANLIGVH